MKKLMHRLTRYPTKPSNIAQYLNTTPQKDPYPRHLGFTLKHMGIPVLHAVEIHERHSQHCTSIGVHTNQHGQPLFCVHTRKINILPDQEKITLASSIHHTLSDDQPSNYTQMKYITTMQEELFFSLSVDEPIIQWKNYPHPNPSAMPWTLQQIIFRQHPLSQHEHIQYIRSIEQIAPRGIHYGDATDKPLHIAPPHIIHVPSIQPPNYPPTFWDEKMNEYQNIQQIPHTCYLLIHPKYTCITQQDAYTKRWYIEVLHATSNPSTNP